MRRLSVCLLKITVHPDKNCHQQHNAATTATIDLANKKSPGQSRGASSSAVVVEISPKVRRWSTKWSKDSARPPECPDLFKQQLQQQSEREGSMGPPPAAHSSSFTGTSSSSSTLPESSTGSSSSSSGCDGDITAMDSVEDFHYSDQVGTLIIICSH